MRRCSCREILLGAALYLFYARLAIQASIWTLLCGHLVICTPYVIRSVTAGLVGLDPRLEEAAMSLGATRVQAFFKVTLPLLRSSLLSGAIFAFIISFSDINLALFLSGPQSTSLPVHIFSQIQWQGDPTIAAASSLQIVIIGTADPGRAAHLPPAPGGMSSIAALVTAATRQVLGIVPAAAYSEEDNRKAGSRPYLIGTNPIDIDCIIAALSVPSDQILDQKPRKSVRKSCPGGRWISTLGPPATAELRCGGRPQRCSRRRRSRRPSADFLVPRGHAFSGHTESKNPVEFRPWSYEFDSNRNARAM